jgi:hypothetical protein
MSVLSSQSSDFLGLPLSFRGGKPHAKICAIQNPLQIRSRDLARLDKVLDRHEYISIQPFDDQHEPGAIEEQDFSAPSIFPEKKKQVTFEQVSIHSDCDQGLKPVKARPHVDGLVINEDP